MKRVGRITAESPNKDVKIEIGVKVTAKSGYLTLDEADILIAGVKDRLIGALPGVRYTNIGLSNITHD